jgi:hypothetical protein
MIETTGIDTNINITAAAGMNATELKSKQVINSPRQNGTAIDQIGINAIIVYRPTRAGLVL